MNIVSACIMVGKHATLVGPHVIRYECPLCINGNKEGITSMTTEDLVIYDGSDRKTVEAVCERLP